MDAVLLDTDVFSYLLYSKTVQKKPGKVTKTKSFQHLRLGRPRLSAV